MKTKEQMQAEYQHRSEILTLGLRRDAWQTIAHALQSAGLIGHAKDIRDFLENQEKAA